MNYNSKKLFKKQKQNSVSNTYNLAFKSQNWVSSVIQGLLGRQPDMMASLDKNCSLYLTILKGKQKTIFPEVRPPRDGISTQDDQPVPLF